ncbi:hypothetical protein ZWY2020_011276 [Hordeum vulgare]|nr:hypothetical protein ZWY2020_011276 [Hordeum vulgare]
MSRPHAVLIPYPAQGHVTPLLNLAKVLHSRGFYVTFVNSEYNHRRLLRSRGEDSLAGLDDFRFETIPDGLPRIDNEDVTQDIPALCVLRHARRRALQGLPGEDRRREAAGDLRHN